MRKLLVLMLLALVPASFMSCTDGRRGHQGEPGITGQAGSDGLNGIGFDYVRAMEGAEVCNSALIVPANLVVPANILALAPSNGGRHLEGLTLTFGHVDSPVRVYLGAVQAGGYCVVEREGSKGWTPVGERLVFVKDGFIAVIPPEFFGFVSPPVLADALLKAHVIDFTGKCYELHYHDYRHLKIGKRIRINFRRD